MNWIGAAIVPLLALLAVLTAPTAGADVGLTLHGVPSSPLEPVDNVAQIDVEVTVDCQHILARAVPPGPGGLAPTTVILESAAADAVTVSLPEGPQKIIDATTCTGPQDAKTVTFSVGVAVSAQAAALEPQPINLTASLHPPTAPGEDAAPRASQSFQVKPDYFALLEAKSDVKLRSTLDHRAAFPLDLTNFGNGATTVSFSTPDDAAPRTGRIILPPAMQLGAAGTDDMTATATVVFESNGRSRATEQAFVIRMTPAFAHDPLKVGEPVDIVFLVRDQGGLPTSEAAASAALPGLLAVAGVGAVAVVAAMRRRRA